jgi:DNA-binding NarL/FixJ family response regulator
MTATVALDETGLRRVLDVLDTAMTAGDQSELVDVLLPALAKAVPCTRVTIRVWSGPPVRADRASTFAGVYRPMGVARQLAGGFALPSGGRVCIAFIRDDATDFTEADLAVLQALLPRLQRLAAHAPIRPVRRELGLTPRQAEVLRLAATGLSDGQIANRLQISPRTVAKHLENTYSRLDARGRVPAVLRLLRPDNG